VPIAEMQSKVVRHLIKGAVPSKSYAENKIHNVEFSGHKNEKQCRVFGVRV